MTFFMLKFFGSNYFISAEVYVLQLIYFFVSAFLFGQKRRQKPANFLGKKFDKNHSVSAN